jgi:hypothetical protein
MSQENHQKSKQDEMVVEKMEKIESVDNSARKTANPTSAEKGRNFLVYLPQINLR